MVLNSVQGHVMLNSAQGHMPNRVQVHVVLHAVKHCLTVSVGIEETL